MSKPYHLRSWKADKLRGNINTQSNYQKYISSGSDRMIRFIPVTLCKKKKEKSMA